MDIKLELQMIRVGFNKVKEDLNDLRKETILLKRENRNLREKIIVLESKKPVTKTKTVTKTVVKHTGSSKYKILGNSKTQKVHYSICPYAKKLSKDNREEFKDVKEALKKGYSRCQCIFNN